MPEVLRYLRQAVYRPKTLQRVRLQAQIESPPPVHGIFNRVDPHQGYYGRLAIRAGNLHYAHATYGIPPYLYEHPATLTGDVTEGRFCWGPFAEQILVYTRASLGVYRKIGNADGVSFGGESQLRATATHPDVVREERTGTVIYAYYLGGVLTIRRQNPGDLTPEAEVSAVDDAAAAFTLADDVFRIASLPDGYWVLHCRRGGSGDTSLWYSTDDCGSFSPYPGAVTGLASATYPGIVADEEGRLFAWAVTGGDTLKLSVRDEGGDFGAFQTVVDDTGADLLVREISSSFVRAREVSDRLVLATIVDGESLPSDWWSGDRTVSFTRL